MKSSHSENLGPGCCTLNEHSTFSKHFPNPSQPREGLSYLTNKETDGVGVGQWGGEWAGAGSCVCLLSFKSLVPTALEGRGPSTWTPTPTSGPTLLKCRVVCPTHPQPTQNPTARPLLPQGSLTQAVWPHSWSGSQLSSCSHLSCLR